jgi:CubicO group peptidase (beta-lactamase class C family)
MTGFVLATLLALLAATSVAEYRGVSAAEGVRDLATAPAESVGVSTERLRRIDEGMKRLVDDKRFAGIVTLLTRRGKIVHHSAVGVKDVSKNDSLQKDSIFRIASMTKPITGAALMMLYEEGKWRLEDPVSRHIPEFAKLQVYTGANPDGTPMLEPARRSMTMRELMTHTGGLGYILNSQSPVDRLIIQGRVLDSAAPLQAMIDKLAKMPLQSQPGTRWSYSIAVDVQGYLVEKLSGQKFDEFLRTRLFEPLGMKDTAFYVPKDKLSRLALVHTEAKGGGLTAEGNRGNPTIVPLGPSGGGGLFSTAMDYARFTQMLLNGGEFNGVRILAPRTVEMMRTNYVNPEPLKTMGPGLGWSLGFQVVTDAAAAGEPYTDGVYTWFGIFGTWFWIDPVEDFAFIGMLQHQNVGASRQVHALSHNLVYQAIIDSQKN